MELFKKEKVVTAQGCDTGLYSYVPVQDVIERSKINEIIEKIKDESYLSYDDNPRRILDEDCVLEIIKEVFERRERVMVIIKDFDAPRNCVDCQNEGLSEIVGCGLFDECGKHPDCPFIEVKETDIVNVIEHSKQQPCKYCERWDEDGYCTWICTQTEENFYCKNWKRRVNNG